MKTLGLSPADAERARHARETAKHLQLLRAARELVLRWRRESRQLYRVDPCSVIALCEAVDESWDALKGGEQAWD